MFKSHKFICFLLISLALQGFWLAENRAAQKNIRFKHLTIDDGLSNNQVYVFLQDRHGFIWMGTQDGLNRYDGQGFRIYQNDPADSTSLSRNWIMDLAEDDDGKIWIATQGGGLNVFDPVTEKFKAYRFDANDPTSLGHDRIIELYFDSDNTLWIGTAGGGINRFDRETGSFVRYLHDPEIEGGLPHNTVRRIIEDPSDPDILWAATFDGLSFFNKKDPVLRFKTYRIEDNASGSANDKEFHAAYFDNEKTFWIGTANNGLYQFDTKIEKFSVFHGANEGFQQTYLYDILQDSAGDLWAATIGNGLFRFKEGMPQPEIYQHDPADGNTLSTNSINTVFEDRSGLIWVGTSGGGVDIYDRRSEKVALYRHDPDAPKSLSSDIVYDIDEDDERNLWIGGEGGLNKFDRATGGFEQVLMTASTPDGASPQTVYALMIDRRDNVWVSGALALDRLNILTGEYISYRNFPENPHSMAETVYLPTVEDQNDAIWVGTWGDGVYRLDADQRDLPPRAAKFRQYKHDPADPNSLSADRIQPMLVDRVGNLWIGTADGGLNKYNPESDNFTRYASDSKKPSGLSGNYVRCLLEDRNGFLWIGTYGGGLNRFDPRTEEFLHFRKKDGFPDDVIMSILEDDAGLLWVCTSKTITRFDPNSGHLRVYDQNDGVQTGEFNSAHFKSPRTGEFFFGGKKGFNAFFPQALRAIDAKAPPVAITNFEKYNVQNDAGSAIPVKGIAELDQVKLSYQDNIFSVNYAALSFRNPSQHKFMYKLEGFNENWISQGAQNSATFTNLDPGDYVFRVKGADEENVWGEEGDALKIIVSPPPWRTWWAYSIYSLTVLLALYGLRRYETNRMALKNRLQIEHVEAEKLKELDHLKSRFFANISHEFRTPLTLILAPLEEKLARARSKQDRQLFTTMTRNAKRLLRLINQLLDLSRIESGKMQLAARRTDLSEFLQLAISYFASAAEQRSIALTFHPPEEKIKVYLDLEKMEQVLYNLISNAFKFTPDHGKIHLSLESTDDFAEIKLRDTGEGVNAKELPHIFDRFYQAKHGKKAKSGTGIGLALAREFVSLHGGELQAESAPGFGSTFKIRLLLGNAHLAPEQIIADDAQTDDIFADIELSELNASAIDVNDGATMNRGASSRDAVLNQASGENGSTKILLVDDNDELRSYLKLQLSESYAIEEAENGVIGLRRAQKSQPDLIISDVMMPEMDGYALCRAVKEDDKLSHIPVILLTAKASDESKLEGLETGADDYIFKPFSAETLRVRVRNLIASRREMRRRFSEQVTLGPSEIAVDSADAAFLQKVQEIIEKHLGDGNFGVERLAEEMALSRRQLHRRVQSITQTSSLEFIRTMRLQRAAQLLEQKAGTVSEIAYQVGFQDVNYFSRLFKKAYGKTPSEYS